MSVYLYLAVAQVTLLTLGQCSDYSAKGHNLQVLYEWNSVDYLWPNEAARTAAIKRNLYIPKNIIVLDVDVYDPLIHNPVCRTNPNSCSKLKRRTFVTTPRFNSGVPATLSTVSTQRRDGKYLLSPFPNWAHHKEGYVGGPNNVFRTTIDECGRLWVLDTGLVDSSSGQSRRVRSAKILIYDLNNQDRLVGSYPIPNNVLDSNSLLITITVDIRNGDGRSAFAYLADVTAFKLIVFDLQRVAFHRIAHKTFEPDPKHGNLTVADTTFQLLDGLFGLALGPVVNNDRKLYYHSFASLKESYVSTAIIRDRAAFLTNERAHVNSFSSFPYERVSQSGPEAMNNNGILFFSSITQNAVACWNSKLVYNVKNTPVIARNDKTMQFPSGLKVIGDDLYVLSSRFQKFSTGALSTSETNFRVLRGSVPNFIKGTVCEK